MDKYLVVVLMFLVAGMGIAITRDPPQYAMFYSMVAGAIIVVIYSSMRTRKEQKELRRKRRKSK